MLRTHAVAWLCSVGCLLSCGCAGAGASRSEPEAAAHARSCADLIARHRAVLASAPGTCATNADCGVYGGLDPDDACGGSTDRATADALSALGAEADAAGCPRPGYSCPPIANRCIDGTCR